jgi:hypothetical protein
VVTGGVAIPGEPGIPALLGRCNTREAKGTPEGCDGSDDAGPWFEDDFGGGGLMPPFDSVDWDADPDWEWHSARDDTPEQLFALLAEARRRGDAVLNAALAPGGVGLDGLSTVEHSRGKGKFSLRWIIVHLIEEYARHNGHADLIRESIDGQKGE